MAEPVVGHRRHTRHVVISGASSGIGLATAQRFAESGDCVTNIDLRPPPAAHPDVSWLSGDVAQWASVGRLLDRAESLHGPVDVVIANAGISIRHALPDCTEAQVRQVFDVNVFGVMALWQEAAMRMLGKTGGVLLATASTNGLAGYPYYADYNASKAAVLSLCKTFALEFAPAIRTATVSPGLRHDTDAGGGVHGGDDRRPQSTDTIAAPHHALGGGRGFLLPRLATSVLPDRPDARPRRGRTRWRHCFGARHRGPSQHR